MSERENNTSVTVDLGGILGLLWLIDAIFLWLNPMGTPAWIMSIFMIFFWIGAILLIILIGLIILMVIAIVIDNH